MGAAGGDEQERARIRSVYRSYEASAAKQRAWSADNPGNRAMVQEMRSELMASLEATGNFPRDGRVLLDIGCGWGHLLGWLRERGAESDCLRGIDLLPDQVEAARQHLEGVPIDVADARALPLPPDSVNAVVMCTVLSSVVSADDRRRMAGEVERVLRRGGVFLCYDLRYTNPLNRNMRPVGRREIERLFPGSSVRRRSLTLLPPLARRLGGATDLLYGRLAAIAPLRTHTLAVVRPRSA